ncbi:LOW QUALITY PROTEIN: solute carrier family 12 member 3-like [Etheostoma spectabile]|uniref:LOW QUALITY PROTEIN: solute carrier family 12 member 3-like n=1 Tax=Etheostoma spectabile TaxID=54343 RepID=UPI0013AF0B80|nr:LOW QUALITY PROTEIN: solute carrier family 12 member 3-like [Etheostoma spectabile]
MGQLTSKLGRLDPGVVPNVHFSTNDEEPPRYSSQGIPSTIISDVESSALEGGSKAGLQRFSAYSTLDMVPQQGHYAKTIMQKNLRSRPSLEALRKAFKEADAEIEVPTTDSGDSSMPDSGTEELKAPQAPVRFGWIFGVLIRTMLNIWGVILFLRLTLITSQAGIVLTWVIILISVAITTITGLAISAIATNGKVLSGQSLSVSQHGDKQCFGWGLKKKVRFQANFGPKLGDLMATFSRCLAFSSLLSPAPFWKVNFVEPFPKNLMFVPKGPFNGFFSGLKSLSSYFYNCASCVVQDASGNITDIMTANMTGDCLGQGCQFGWNFTECIVSQSCHDGLANTQEVMGQLSAWYYLVNVGSFAATLSSSLGYLVSAPKIFQCLCRDNIYPYIGVFGKGYGKNDEPLRAYLLSFIIAVAFTLIGDLNIIAMLNSSLFMAVYTIINFSCFHASFTNSPGWRPQFIYYDKWVSLFGAVVSFVLMFIFSWWAGLVTLIIFILLWLYIYYKKPNLNWGTSIQAGSYNIALSASVALACVEDHVKNFRPQCLVLTGPPTQRPALVDFVNSFTKHASLMICGDIIMDQDKKTRPQEATDQLVKWMNKRKVHSFYSPFTANSLRSGAQNLLQASGLGKLKPNTLVLGFKSNWEESAPESIEDYVNTINDTFDSNNCLCILRMMDGLDVSDQFDFKVNQGFEPDESVEKRDQPSSEGEPSDDGTDKGDGDETVFQDDQGKKTIDIYWIADDGGLTLLVPYLISRRKRWSRCRVRVFIVGEQLNKEESRKEMLALLKRFRLDFKDVRVLTDCERRPQAKNLERFFDSVAPFRLYDEPQEGVSISQNVPWKISDREFEAFKLKSETKVRLNEIIRKNSKRAAIVFVSLPVPHSDCTSALYMAWLDTLSYGLHCPVVLIRGNQENVLTFYCQ